jgi:hypothetical protein
VLSGVTICPMSSRLGAVSTDRDVRARRDGTWRRLSRPGFGEATQVLRVEDQLRPRCVSGQMQDGAPCGAGDASGDGEDPQPQPFRFPPARPHAGEGEHLHPRGQLAGQGDDGAPDLVLREAVQRQVRQLGVLGERIRSSARARLRCRNSSFSGPSGRVTPPSRTTAARTASPARRGLHPAASVRTRTRRPGRVPGR